MKNTIYKEKILAKKGDYFTDNRGRVCKIHNVETITKTYPCYRYEIIDYNECGTIFKSSLKHDGYKKLRKNSK